MSQQDAAKQQANTRNNIRVVSIFTAAAVGFLALNSLTTDCPYRVATRYRQQIIIIISSLESL
ncbi:HlyD family secretion protein [Klebsiella pneumoniae]|nr:hypothetical protein [Klebsiella pneumoniae]SXB22768.1 HlyD family secretion protein [Klebsiella pneumoniae]HBR0098804.1 hypothetical protein [Klebsiella pneumoniae]HBR0103686.1 hypothetical protein [Klebsiella pneumoniae]HBR0845091.1 hypothetical protein [Klebsiella pneumoniae]